MSEFSPREKGDVICTMRTVKEWNCLSGQAAESPSWEVFKTSQDEALNNLIADLILSRMSLSIDDGLAQEHLSKHLFCSNPFHTLCHYYFPDNIKDQKAIS